MSRERIDELLKGVSEAISGNGDPDGAIRLFDDCAATLPEVDVLHLGALAYYLLLGGYPDRAKLALASIPAQDVNAAVARQVIDLVDKGQVVEATYMVGAAYYDATNRMGGKDFVKRSLADLTRNDIVLDIACGTGQLGVQARLAGFQGQIIGSDLSQSMLAIAQKTGAYNGLYCMDALSFVEAVNGQARQCFILGLLYFLSDDEACRLISKAAERLVPGGRLIFNFPVRVSETQRMVPAMHCHDPAHLRQAAEAAGMTFTKVDGPVNYPVVACRRTTG